MVRNSSRKIQRVRSNNKRRYITSIIRIIDFQLFIAIIERYISYDKIQVLFILYRYRATIYMVNDQPERPYISDKIAAFSISEF